MKKITLFQLILLINVIWAVVILEIVNIVCIGTDGAILMIVLGIVALAGGIPIGMLFKAREV